MLRSEAYIIFHLVDICSLVVHFIHIDIEWSWFKSQMFLPLVSFVIEQQHFSFCSIFFFIVVVVLFCASNLRWSDQLLQNQRWTKHVTYMCVSRAWTFCTLTFDSSLALVLALPIDFGNNDNWQSNWYCASNRETVARKRICGLRKCGIFLLSAKRVCKTFLLLCSV